MDVPAGSRAENGLACGLLVTENSVQTSVSFGGVTKCIHIQRARQTKSSFKRCFLAFHIGNDIDGFRLRHTFLAGFLFGYELFVVLIDLYLCSIRGTLTLL